MPPVTYRGAKSRSDKTGSVQLTEDGKDYLLRKDFEEDVPAALVKRLKSEEFSAYNFDFGQKQEG